MAIAPGQIEIHALVQRYPDPAVAIQASPVRLPPGTVVVVAGKAMVVFPIGVCTTPIPAPTDGSNGPGFGNPIYATDQVCPFRFIRAAWRAFSNFQPLAVPIVAGPWTFPTSEHLYQASKFGARPNIQQRIAEAPTAREAAAIGRTPDLGIDHDWNARRVDVMRCVLRMKREANPANIDAVLAATGDRPIVVVSTRDPCWGRAPS